jgi:hypothetical protein
MSQIQDAWVRVRDQGESDFSERFRLASGRSNTDGGHMQDHPRLRGRIGRALALLDMVESARTQGMDAADLGLLVVLASHADERGAAYPSQSTLAREVGRARPWVNRRLAALGETDLGGRRAIEKTRHRLPKGGETSCRYRLPRMDLGAVGATTAESIGDTPCSKLHHEQEDHSNHQECLSQGADARESADSGTGGREKIGPGWVPTTDDIAFAAAKRPDLLPGDLLLLTEKLIAHHAGRLPRTDASTVFRRWVLTERVCRHDHASDHNRFSGRFREHDHRASGTPGGRPAARAANRDKALVALALLAG